MAETVTCGGTMSGNCDTGMRISDSAARQCQQNGDNDREPRPIDENAGDHAMTFPRFGGAVGGGGWPGRG